MKNCYVYILTNKQKTVLYIGVTNNLQRRVWEHKNHFFQGFSEKYKTDLLVWFEALDSIEDAISLEKRMKKWKREWKEKRINQLNPNWKDLFESLTE